MSQRIEDLNRLYEELFKYRDGMHVHQAEFGELVSLAESFEDLGEAFQGMGVLAEAQECLAVSSELYWEVVARKPSDSEYASALAFVLLSKGEISSSLAQYESAIADLQECRELFEECLSIEPEEQSFLAGLATSHTFLALSHAASTPSMLAWDAIASSIEVWRKVCRLSSDETDSKMGLCGSLLIAAEIGHSMGIGSQTLPYLEEGSKLSEQLCRFAGKEDVAKMQLIQAYFYAAQGVHYKDHLNEREKATELLEEAKLLTELLGIETPNDDDLHELMKGIENELDELRML